LSHDARRLLQKTGDTISKPLNAIGRIFSEALDGAEGKLSYLPGPFAPFELGREQRMEQAAKETWLHPDEQRQFGYPGAAQTPTGTGVGYVVPMQTPYKQRVRRTPSPSLFQSPNSPGFSVEDTPTRQGVGGPHTHQPLSMGPSQSQLPFNPRVHSLAQSGMDSNVQPGSVSRTPTPILDIASMQAEIDSAHEKAAAAAMETLLQIFPGMDKEVVGWVLEANEGDLGKSIEGLLEMSTAS
jgi:Rab5 GDP/GTP exchange factor